MPTIVVHDRIGFKEFDLEKLPENRCQARVVLVWPDGSEFTGTAQDEDSESGRLRCAVEATVRTVERSVRGIMALRVQGVRAIEESNNNIIVTLLSSELLGETRPLVGSCLMREAPERSAALSVLKATNRLLGNVIFTNRDETRAET